MSRRKPKLAELPGPEYSRNQPVRLICTDRGRHAPVLVRPLLVRQVFTGPGDLKRPPEGQGRQRRKVGWSREVTWPERQRRPAPVAEWESADGGRSFRFKCSSCTCRRDVQVQEDKLLEVLDAISNQQHGDGHPELDLWMLEMYLRRRTSGC